MPGAAQLGLDAQPAAGAILAWFLIARRPESARQGEQAAAPDQRAAVPGLARAAPYFGMRRLHDPAELGLIEIPRVFELEERRDVVDIRRRQRPLLLGRERNGDEENDGENLQPAIHAEILC